MSHGELVLAIGGGVVLVAFSVASWLAIVDDEDFRPAWVALSVVLTASALAWIGYWAS